MNIDRIKNHKVPGDVEELSNPDTNLEIEKENNSPKTENRLKGAEITDLDERVEALVREIGQIRECIRKNEMLGIESQALSGKQKTLVDKVESLEGEKSAWAEENEEKEMPEGVSVEKGENDWSTKVNLDHGQTEEMSKEQRRELIDDWKKSAVLKFTRHLEHNWRCQDALNLQMAVDVIKNNVPLVIEKKSVKFLDGSSNLLPDFIVMNFKVNSFIDSLRGKPNMIRELKLDFAGESEVLADEQVLVKEDAEDGPGSNKKEFSQAA